MEKNTFTAVIFDLDGVITQTAAVHSAAWKKMFDEYLKERKAKYNETFQEFTHQHDYLNYVDGKPRYEGVASFLESRGISIPYGDPSDDPEKETICGLGNRKDRAFNETLKSGGVKVFPSTTAFIKELHANNIRTGVASSSKNCKNVLEAAGLDHLFETRVDGTVSSQLNLKGKPEPDIFTQACDNLGVAYEDTVIVEDAVSGVQAGKNGRFGLVLGIAREKNFHELKKHGADIVISDMDEISIEDINQWFKHGLPKDQWSLTYYDYDPAKEKTREALLTVGNGYFGTRGAFEETSANDYNYPGTYIAGIYNRLKTRISDRDIENEDFVNCPNWLPVNFKIDDNEWFDINQTTIKSIERRLHFKTGVLTRDLVVVDAQQRETRIRSERVASMHNPHHAGLRYTITPLNYSGKFTIVTGLNGAIINDGVERYRSLNQKHLKPHSQKGEKNNQFLTVETTQSGILIAEAANLKTFYGEKELHVQMHHEEREGAVYSSFEAQGEAGKPLTVEKTVTIFTSRDKNVNNPSDAARREIDNAPGYSRMKADSEKVWQALWEEMDVVVDGDRFSQKLLRLHMTHLMVTASPHNKNIDAGVTARGLHGEAYRGHIFWDELYILPFYFIHFPDVARSLLMYRYRRLDEARKNAAEYGYEGAMFPWQSGSSGREETQVVHLNPLTGEWGPDNSSLQRHISLAIAFNVWQYYHTTNDLDFIKNHGAEMFLEICRFWSSKAEFNGDDARYHIPKVMGPDEFHEKYPDKDEGGLEDNAYTNIMTVWAIRKAFKLLEIMDDESIQKLKAKIKLTEDELERWKDIAQNMNVVMEEDILAQYDGFFQLKELNWQAYKKKYDNIHRMDRILKAEGESPDDYKVSKQADTLMTFYNLNKDEVTDILKELGYNPGDDYLAKNLDYYLKRTTHGSTLSRVVHALLANMAGDDELSWQLFQEALASDYNDIQGGTTGEGIHVGVMSGTVMIALTTYAGMNYNGEILHLAPNLPEWWKRIAFHMKFKGVDYHFEIKENKIETKAQNPHGNESAIMVYEEEYKLPNNEWVSITI
ncbi:MAG: beta-phosphoglucomutase family hydrolase [Bacteroidales bacterium]|nr:beta-phosphoglucomutase family hydrolase [Bacteroidales bacterium]MCF8332880.1 beta-phosphoglucomutase family hydrolase [Bacteroidales bacterium]